MKNKRILISGASIAGPSLGYWLQRYGFDVTIIELAPAPRKGGYKIDIRGKAIDVVKMMGIYEDLRPLSIVMLRGTFLDEKGNVIDEIAGEYMGMHALDDVEIWREDLSRVLYEATSESCEYLFGDSIQSVVQNYDKIEVKFASGDAREFDILVGADGIHSNVRSLVFGKESLFSHNLGDYFAAICTIQTELKLDQHEMFYSKKDKLFNVYCTQTGQDAKALFVFRSSGLKWDYKNINEQKEIVSRVYADAEWKIPEMLNAMQHSTDFYFDEVKQIRMEKWSKDRTIVIGDAAFSPSLASGQGTSLALVGAYVLASGLKRAQGNYQAAFENYEKEMRSFVDVNQQLGEVIIEHMIPKEKAEAWIGPSIFNQIQFAANHIDLQKLQK